jgi:hypothetical protein
MSHLSSLGFNFLLSVMEVMLSSLWTGELNV